MLDKKNKKGGVPMFFKGIKGGIPDEIKAILEKDGMEFPEEVFSPERFKKKGKPKYWQAYPEWFWLDNWNTTYDMQRFFKFYVLSGIVPIPLNSAGFPWWDEDFGRPETYREFGRVFLEGRALPYPMGWMWHAMGVLTGRVSRLIVVRFFLSRIAKKYEEVILELKKTVFVRVKEIRDYWFRVDPWFPQGYKGGFYRDFVVFADGDYVIAPPSYIACVGYWQETEKGKRYVMMSAREFLEKKLLRYYLEEKKVPIDKFWGHWEGFLNVRPGEPFFLTLTSEGFLDLLERMQKVELGALKRPKPLTQRTNFRI